jgi:hypothetical protein
MGGDPLNRQFQHFLQTKKSEWIFWKVDSFECHFLRDGVFIVVFSTSEFGRSLKLTSLFFYSVTFPEFLEKTRIKFWFWINGSLQIQRFRFPGEKMTSKITAAIRTLSSIRLTSCVQCTLLYTVHYSTFLFDWFDRLYKYHARFLCYRALTENLLL